MRADPRTIERFAALVDDRRSEPPAELAPLLRIVDALQQLPVPRLDPTTRTTLRTRVVAAATAPPVPWRQRVAAQFAARVARWRGSLRLATASALASTMIGTAGVAVAAQQALPGELLYPVKQATETVRLALARDLVAAATLRLSLARERVEEVERGATSLSSELLATTLRQAEAQAEAGARPLIEAVREGAEATLLDPVIGTAEELHRRVLAVRPALPTEVRPVAAETAAAFHALASEAEAVRCGCAPSALPLRHTTSPVVGTVCDRCAPAPAPTAPATPAPSTEPPPADPTPASGTPEAPAEPSPPAPSEEPALLPPLPGPLEEVGAGLEDVLRELVDLLEGGAPTDGVDDADLLP